MTAIRESVARILDGFGTAVGVGEKVTLTWSRTGAAEFELLAGRQDQWTAERIYGRLGRFSVALPSSQSKSVRVVDPQVQYEINGRDVTLTAKAVVSNLTRYMVANDDRVGSPVGFFGMSVMSLFSLLPLIWSLLNPRFTLLLPSEIVMDAMLVDSSTSRQLLIEFTRGQPVVKASWGIQFTMAPVRLSVAESVITADYRAGIFSRSQTWSL